MGEEGRESLLVRRLRRTIKAAGAPTVRDLSHRESSDLGRQATEAWIEMFDRL